VRFCNGEQTALYTRPGSQLSWKWYVENVVCPLFLPYFRMTRISSMRSSPCNW
jgi:hypothetical protein